MLDPFALYGRMVSAAFDMASTMQRASETMSASRQVVERRTEMMQQAVRSPFEGNYAELGRMIPEKIDAFSRAGSAIAADWWAMQSAFMAQAQHLGAMAMRGRAPTFAELAELSTRNAAYALRTVERAGKMGAKGLKPIHATATANARRLKREAASS